MRHVFRPRAWVLVALAAAAGLFLFAPRDTGSAATAPRTTSVSVPRSGELTVARTPLVVASAKQAARLRKRLPAVRLRNRSALPSGSSLYTGVRFKPGSRTLLELLVVIARPGPGQLSASASAVGPVKLDLALPRGVSARWGGRSQELNSLSNRGKPRSLCTVSLPRRYTLLARLTAGTPLSYPKGKSADPRTVLVQALALACGRSYDPAFKTAVNGGGGPGPAIPPGKPTPQPSPQPQPVVDPPPNPATMHWTYTDSSRLTLLGDVVSNSAFDRLEVRMPYRPPDSPGLAIVPRRVVGYKPPAQLPSCTVTTTGSPQDTLVCVGGTVAANEHAKLELQPYPEPGDGMGGTFLVSLGSASKGPFNITGP